MAFTSWRGIAGIIKPTLRPGSLEELIRILPRGIGVIPMYNDIREGKESEFRAVIGGYEEKTKALAEAGCDFVHPGGAPPFLILGYEGERDLIKQWEKKYDVPVFTSGQNTISALRALHVKKFLGVNYLPGPLNETYAQYFIDAGFDCLAMEPIDVVFNKVQELSSLEVYRFVREHFLKHRDAEAIYMLGPAWHRSIDVVEMMERDFGIPVVHHITAQSWEFQLRCHVREPISGYGRLLSELPALP